QVDGFACRAALLRMGEQWCIPQGATPTTHIIKLPIGEIKQPNATLTACANHHSNNSSTQAAAPDAYGIATLSVAPPSTGAGICRSSSPTGGNSPSR
ncbi:hypothetical protein AB0093_26795, partial [Klebsiella pneumoniae]